MRHLALSTFVVLVAVSLTSSPANAGLGKFMKNVVKDDTSSTTTTTESTSEATTASAQTTEPMTYENSKFGYSVALPNNWQLLAGDEKSTAVVFRHLQTANGGLSVNASPMPADFPIDTSLSAQEKSYKEREKRGELSKVMRKDFKNPDTGAIFKGYVTVETAEDNDPDIQRLQWIGYGKGNYYNFTWSTDDKLFPERLPQFEQILEKVTFE